MCKPSVGRWVSVALALGAGAGGCQHQGPAPGAPEPPPTGASLPVVVATPTPAAEAEGTRTDPLVIVQNGPATGAAGGGEFDVGAIRARGASKQTTTAPAHTVKLALKLDQQWQTRVGTTTFRTTMAQSGATVVIGTHGKTLKGLGERDDGVYVLEGATGKVLATIRPPGTGDLDVGGIAVHADRIYFGTDNGWVVAAALGGARQWSHQLKGKVRPAPSLADLNGDGQVDVVVGDEEGTLAAIDGATGKRLWSVQTGSNDYGAKGFIGGAAIADLDRDGRLEVVAGARDGILAAYRADGQVMWQAAHSSGIHASPELGDFDGDGSPEVLAAWSYGDVSVLDGESGTELWGQTLQQDDGGIEGLFGTPVPLPGAPGVLVPAQREFKTFEDRVSASAVVTDIDNDGALEAIVGTEKGLLLALRADGGRAVLATLKGGIEAAAMLADVDTDGSSELLVASRDGLLTCFHTGSTAKPFLARSRNTGELGVVKLGWRASLATGATPTSGVGSSPGSVRIDYLRCCSALQQAALRAPVPQNRVLLQAAGSCNQLAASGTSRAEAMRTVAQALAGQTTVPAECQ
jgi:outer membrane protein assembly factor BamB